MIVSGINIYGNSIRYNSVSTVPSSKDRFLPNKPLLNGNYNPQPTQDIFKKSEPHRNVSFLGGFTYVSKAIQAEFPASFFRKLAGEHLPCAYTGIEMISRADYDELIRMGVLKQRSAVAIKFLKKFKNNMFETEKTIFTMLETESKKHPNLKLQELLQLKYPAAEEILINQQSGILNKINIIIRELPKSEYQNVRKLIKTSFDKIFEQNPPPEDRFRRKDFLYHLKKAQITDKNIKQKIIETAEKLPNSETSINAFIVKYSQPYKIKYEDGEPFKRPRDSEEIGLRLLYPSLATDEHIYPEMLYNKEAEARINGNREAKNLSRSRVTILTTERINGIKDKMLLDDFIKISSYDIKTNIQNHINSLCHLAEVWMKKKQIEDSHRLTKYIEVLKEEFERRSNIVSIDTTDLNKILPEISDAYQNISKRETKKTKKARTHADNSHKENYISSGGKIMQNRKVQRHSSRFSQ